jgi:hypothetical protein
MPSLRGQDPSTRFFLQNQSIVQKEDYKEGALVNLVGRDFTLVGTGLWPKLYAMELEKHSPAVCPESKESGLLNTWSLP